jgi:hypothetical protein
MKKTSFLFCLVLLFAVSLHTNAQIAGCTDPQATNYNPSAVINNGSCTYAALNYSPPLRVELGTSLREISGITYYKGNLLGIIDDINNNKIFVIDTLTGAVKQTITVDGATNYDWEEITQDSTHIYIGDFGNNYSGNRKDLQIFKIAKTAFLDVPGDYTIPASAVEKIAFSYPDQTDFTAVLNNTRFDCEAFVIRNNKIHLFTKNWIGDYSVHYSLPTEPGVYVATRLDSLNTGNLMVTGASLGAHDELLLTAYEANTSTLTFNFALYLIYGFDHTDYFFNTGNKRKITLPGLTTTGQVEGVCFVNATHGFLSNEYSSQSVLTITNKLRTFNTLNWILDYYKNNPRYPGEPGMVRYNSTVDKYEVFTGTYWEYLGE